MAVPYTPTYQNAVGFTSVPTSTKGTWNDEGNGIIALHAYFAGMSINILATINSFQTALPSIPDPGSDSYGGTAVANFFSALGSNACVVLPVNIVPVNNLITVTFAALPVISGGIIIVLDYKYKGY